jgi:hypothetical protein
MVELEKAVCRRCGWRGKMTERLTAVSPFDPDDILLACPYCKTVDSIDEMCDEGGCWDNATCGTPTENGYRRVCGVHFILLTSTPSPAARSDKEE